MLNPHVHLPAVSPLTEVEQTPDNCYIDQPYAARCSYQFPRISTESIFPT